MGNHWRNDCGHLLQVSRMVQCTAPAQHKHVSQAGQRVQGAQINMQPEMSRTVVAVAASTESRTTVPSAKTVHTSSITHFDGDGSRMNGHLLEVHDIKSDTTLRHMDSSARQGLPLQGCLTQCENKAFRLANCWVETDSAC